MREKESACVCACVCVCMLMCVSVCVCVCLCVCEREEGGGDSIYQRLINEECRSKGGGFEQKTAFFKGKIDWKVILVKLKIKLQNNEVHYT